MPSAAGFEHTQICGAQHRQLAQLSLPQSKTNAPSSTLITAKRTRKRILPCDKRKLGSEGCEAAPATAALITCASLEKQHSARPSSVLQPSTALRAVPDVGVTPQLPPGVTAPAAGLLPHLQQQRGQTKGCGHIW